MEPPPRKENQDSEHESTTATDESYVKSYNVPLAFDCDTLSAIAKVYLEEGDEEYKKGHLQSAKHFYTEGLQVNCSDEHLNAELYCRRAKVHFCLGNYQETRVDATVAVQLAPTLLEAIGYGVRACMELQLYEEASNWCLKGRAFGKHHTTLQTIADHERDLKIAKSVGDRVGEGRANENLGNYYDSIGDFKKAVEHHERHLNIAKELGDRTGEGVAYENVGKSYHRLGDFKKAIKHHESLLKIVKEWGDKVMEGRTYGNLGNSYCSLGAFKKAMEYYERQLKIAKDEGDKAGERLAYANVGNGHLILGDIKKAIEHHQRHLKLAKSVGDKAGEGQAYGNLGNSYYSLGDLKKAIEHHECCLKVCKEVGDKFGEGGAYGNLGVGYRRLGDFKRAIEHHERRLKVAKELGDKAGEGRAHANLGLGYHGLGDFKRAIEHHERDLKIAKEVGDKAGEGVAYANLGISYESLGDVKKSIELHKCHLKIAKEVGDKAGEGGAYGNLGNCYHRVGDFWKAIEHHERHLKIAKELGDKAAEGHACANLGFVYDSLSDFKAIEHHERHLKIAKEVGDKAVEGLISTNLAQVFEYQEFALKAISFYNSGLTKYDEVRAQLQFKDEWKISYSETYNLAYRQLWRLYLKQGQVLNALRTAERGRAQALRDLMEMKYISRGEHFSWFSSSLKSSVFNFRCLPTTTVFMAISEEEIVFWVIHSDNKVDLRRKELNDCVSEKDVRELISTLNHNALEEIGARSAITCENRSLYENRNQGSTTERAPASVSRCALPNESFRKLYDIIIAPIVDLVRGDDFIFVPEGPLSLVPFAALVNLNMQYLSETFRIRVIPSLSTLQLVTDCPEDFHRKTGALLVGDPYLEEVLFKGNKLCQLPYSKKEVEMVGKILDASPLIGKKATKDEVLKRLSAVALVHIAAHGAMETGEIALAPNPTRESHQPEEKDFLLTMTDVSEADLRARLVVLSCCHSARGEIKAEGVVGIARAFLGAGARSVLVSLWAIDDEATFQFMKHFYEELVKGKRVSEALNQAMRSMRKSETFKEVKYWAPFVLIGDDVTLEHSRSGQRDVDAFQSGSY
ncbi:tetratricopeptide repeat protein 28-like [Stylophora pistillata]|uniref:tetratricopeptide repeat protein 28-like n=1 Tax=Stylophora pistillata TaxID=50429 RepID=UPI000C054D41|nr:tetratricopeptide repeat protein 28-like [Stylophora pistillata]